MERKASDEFSFGAVEKFVSEEGYNFKTTATWVVYLEDDDELAVYKDGTNGFSFTGKVPKGASVDDLYLDFEPYLWVEKEGAIPLFFYFLNRQKACQYNK